jgi:hypothetical protein
MKLSELNVGSIYAVVPSWNYNSRESRDPSKVRENDVFKAELISKDKYVYLPAQKFDNQNTFKKAQAGDKSAGVIVKHTDPTTSKETYWTARLADIVEEWSKLEPVWQAKQSAEQKAQEEADKQRRLEAEHHKKIANAVENSRTSIPKTVADIVGGKCGEVEVGSNGYGLNARAVVTLSLEDFETLVEMAYQGKEVYA